MNIVINGIPLMTYRTGVGQYIYNLCDWMNKIDDINKYTFYYGFFSNTLLNSQKLKANNVYRIKRAIRNIPILGSCFARNKGKVARFFSAINEYDLYFEPNFLLLPEIKAKKNIVTVHDLSFMLNPRWFPAEENEVFCKRFIESIPRIDHIITDSHYVKKQIINELKIESTKISAIYISYNDRIYKQHETNIIRNTLKKFNIKDNYILFVGTVEPRKNIMALLKAYKQISESIRKEYKLLIVGASGWLNKEVYDFVEKNKLKEYVLFTGYVNDEEVAHLMTGATVFVYPSFYEGFGLPPLEAMACGTPVIVSNTSSMYELYKDVAYMVDPHDFTTIGQGLERLLNDNNLQQSYREKGLEYAKNFSWKESAKKTIDVFQKVANA